MNIITLLTLLQYKKRLFYVTFFRFSFLCSSIKTPKFKNNNIVMSINVCLLGNVKAADLLRVGVQGHQFNFQSLMLFNLPGLHAIVSYIK